MHANPVTGPPITEMFSASVCTPYPAYCHMCHVRTNGWGGLRLCEVLWDFVRLDWIGLDWVSFSQLRLDWVMLPWVGIRLDEFWWILVNLEIYTKFVSELWMPSSSSFTNYMLWEVKLSKLQGAATRWQESSWKMLNKYDDVNFDAILST